MSVFYNNSIQENSNNTPVVHNSDYYPNNQLRYFRQRIKDLYRDLTPWFKKKGLWSELYTFSNEEDRRYSYIHIGWGPTESVDGYILTFNHDTIGRHYHHDHDTSKLPVCEASLKNREGSLYSLEPKINWLYSLEEIYSTFYRWYSYLHIHPRIPTQHFAWKLRNLLRKRQQSLSLMTMAQFHLSTSEIALSRQMTLP